METGTVRILHISNAKGRDARVQMLSLGKKEEKKTYQGPDKQPVKPARVLKGTIRTNITALLKQHGGLEAVAKAIKDGDPEIDYEVAGALITKTRKVILSPEQDPAYSFDTFEVVRAPDGREIDRRPAVTIEANINTDDSIKWSGKTFPKSETAKKFAFVRSYQLTHTDGLSFDFLYEMAKTIEAKNSLMLVGAGNNGTDPIVMAAGQPQYRAFIEGRTDGDRYVLLLHLTSMELKPAVVREN